MTWHTLENLHLTPGYSPDDLEKLVQRQVKPAGASLLTLRILRESLDARGTPRLLLHVAVELDRPVAALHPWEPPTPLEIPLLPAPVRAAARPVVIGAGPSGLCAAWLLARAGLSPVIVDRGADVDGRRAGWSDFERERHFSTAASLVFGEGGAGTFSDGKLTTRRNDPLLSSFFAWLVRHGAPDDILYRAKPHVGSDRLVKILPSIRAELIHLGATFLWNTDVTAFVHREGRLDHLETTAGPLPCTDAFVATGTSGEALLPALEAAGVHITPRPLQVGVRMEQPAPQIRRAVYGKNANLPGLPAAEYQFVLRQGSMRSFCMCPGGSVVCSAALPDQLVVNGMSLRARDGAFSNAALIVTLDPLSGWREAVDFRADLERRAFSAGGGTWAAPAQTISSFLKGQSPDTVPTSYRFGATPHDLRALLPGPLTAALAAGLRHLPGVLPGVSEGLLLAPETRVSPGWRLERDEHAQSAPGLFVCGEGSGYASGISTSALDGLKVAQGWILSKS
ncbi:MAG: hypothetical protein CVU65_03555 [Deltaproteobacteria bacterium HGW-Deltaproteobacteria-22]|nr:MAG: hypothetical protein CVU65_03555 [Deltaproteobacteria bacterium HGW-Deltaproteobacteria-22]